ncbi:hypothetical protein PZ938_17095 [Luteipulveratus sp. YIM 133132]|uniref:hypothetical protein n=1 Tax=Luteipulveratus flavus TaxID=3031728 RepID=UPI0023AEAB68|nr:hypothetical protein [Luteipulveratus sp. YIM 133132]MDE9367339.1 hypothetical protein [Luteipulveratus sp. YIM 133132]
MQLYADLRGRRTRQLVTDTLVLTWVLVWVAVGRSIATHISDAGGSARHMEDGGRDFASSMSDAGDRLRKVPVVGDDLKPPFDKASQAGSSISQAGRDIQDGFDRLGLLLGILVAALPICLVVLVWAQARWRYARRVETARKLDALLHEESATEVVRHMVGLDLASLGLLSRHDTATAVQSPAT